MGRTSVIVLHTFLLIDRRSDFTCIGIIIWVLLPFVDQYYDVVSHENVFWPRTTCAFNVMVF